MEVVCDMDKQTLRKKYLKIRKDIANKNLKSKSIFNQIIKTKEYEKANIIAIYNSLNSEVNTNDLIDYSISKNKIVLLPRVVNDDLVFYKIDSHTILIKSEFNVFEPISNPNNYISSDKIDIIIIPGVCFDKDRNRLGMGKGYYDRYLKNIKATKIGICFSEQLIKSIPIDNNDIKMDLIITDKEII